MTGRGSPTTHSLTTTRLRVTSANTPSLTCRDPNSRGSRESHLVRGWPAGSAVGAAVDLLADDVRVARMAGGHLDHVGQYPPQVRR
jgi:hypothetical protein